MLLQLAWAPGKGVKGREYKEYFDTEQGVTFIPWSKLGTNVDLQTLSEGSWIDPETVPPGHQNTMKEGTCSFAIYISGSEKLKLLLFLNVITKKEYIFPRN